MTEQHTSGYENFIFPAKSEDKEMMRVALARNV